MFKSLYNCFNKLGFLVKEYIGLMLFVFSMGLACLSEKQNLYYLEK